MRILLVEDDRLIGDGIKAGLSKMGFSVDWFTDGKTGQAALSEQPLLASITEARGRGDAALQLERVFGPGIAPDPLPGRLDDYRWPR